MTGDDPLSAVIASLERRNERFALIDQRDILDTTVELTAGPRLGGTITVRGRSTSLDEVGAVYLRQYDARKLPDVVDGGPAAAARVASIETALWSWAEHTDAQVFNRPSAMASNSSKPYQAAIIQAVGFATPPTLITTDPAAARAFWQRHGSLIYKSVSSVRSVVSRLAPGDEARLGDVVTCPTQFQKYIPGHDVRVHVVGDDVFPSLVESGADDYRYASQQGSTLEMSACTLPDDVLARCRALSARLRLPLAGIDLRITPGGEWYCFEVNPSPSFTFYQRRTYQPISETFTQLLIDRARDHAREAPTQASGAMEVGP
jgi:glutathione synthase/RimK-type ligase-like ATP-grasp enzyme